MQKPKPIIPPRHVWIVFDPKGRAREVFIKRPDEDALTWVWKSDQKGGPSHLRIPKDRKTARTAGYRLKRIAVSVVTDEIERLRNIIGNALPLLDTGHLGEARAVLTLGSSDSAAPKP